MSEATSPAIFPWFENRVETCLSKLHKLEPQQQRIIAQTIKDLHASTHFWKLMTAFTDATDSEKDREGQFAVLSAMLSRMFIAGSYHGFPLEEDVCE